MFGWFKKKRPAPAPALPVNTADQATLAVWLDSARALALEEFPWRGGMDAEFAANILFHAYQGATIEGLRYVLRQSDEWKLNAQYTDTPRAAVPYVPVYSSPVTIEGFTEFLKNAVILHREEFPNHKPDSVEWISRFLSWHLNEGLTIDSVGGIRARLKELGPFGEELQLGPDLSLRQPAGKVGLVGNTFVDGNGPFLGLIATHMDALNLVETDLERFHRNVEFIASYGMDQRVLTILGWDGDERVDPRKAGHFERLAYVIDYAFDRGVRTELTAFADLFFVPELHSQSGRRRYADDLVTALRGREHKLLFVEGCNEPGNGDLWSNFGSASQLVDISRYIGEQLGVPYAAGALYGGPYSTTAFHLSEGVLAPEAQVLIDGCPLVSVHLDRGLGVEGLWRSIRQPWEARQGKPFINNEPIGYDSSVEWLNNRAALRRTPMSPGGSNEQIDQFGLDLQRIAALTAYMSGATAHCWHTEGGTGYSSDRDLRFEPGAAEVAAARAVLPADLPNFQFHNWHWPSNPVITKDGCIYDKNMKGRGTLRTLAATNGGRVAIYTYCVPEGASFEARQSMELTEYRFNRDLKQYVAQNTFRINAGASFETGPTLDVLYIGRFI